MLKDNVKQPTKLKKNGTMFVIKNGGGVRAVA
jgi:hypothetical protein